MLQDTYRVSELSLILLSCSHSQIYCPIDLAGVVKEPLESLGDSITTAVLLSWSKNPGDAVKEDDVIGVVETDKVS